ncbi:M20/M25/M40 family metallo-hydrolase [Temperatibacter marinus]|uniref:Carboxypeptidase Q n=1 Tax=Temperatibacter marinus TaxID=1456591 RepID=A0AA52EHV0_9PROT|nr:M20/M25/M40 family metallo-hydrolase [Temperatibacter marinus]WND02817.1 M20/M25/M40 family metallo-hydrolase [Temperatibacter marinus]
MFKKFMLTALVAASVTGTVNSAEKIDLEVMTAIRHEGFVNSQVMKTLTHLTDKIGSRLTGSPAMREANDWTLAKLQEWGLKNAHLEPFDFGRGWTFEHVSIAMTAPKVVSLQGIPVSWHPGTQGEIEAEVIHINTSNLANLKKYEGKLKGKIVAISSKKKIRDPREKMKERLSEDRLDEMTAFKVPNKVGEELFPIDMFASMINKAGKIDAFLKKEGALASVNGSWRDAALINATAYNLRKGFTPEIPQVMLSAESYNRILRRLENGEPVKIKMNVGATFYDADPNGYNTIAEIPGSGRKKSEIVMAGAHLDSWFMGDGAVDNGAGVAVVMEAIRILKALNIKPKRTIRVGLWSGEEQGLYGSLEHVFKHYADFPKADVESRKRMAPTFQRDFKAAPSVKKAHEKFSVYYNLDNGSGKIRGIYAEHNSAAAAIFKQWLAPFKDLDAKTVTLNRTSGTDHLSFQMIGLPGYQFIQDPLDYGSRLHHTQIDVIDHVEEADLKQASVIMAAFIYNAAMRDERMPRKPMPKARQ